MQLENVQNTRDNIRFTICKNTKPTNTEIKCSIASNLKNIKSVESITLNPIQASSQNTKLNLYLDQSIKIPGNLLSINKDFIVHLDASAEFLLFEGYPIEQHLISEKIQNNHQAEAIVSPSSCSNLTLTEKIIPLIISFSGHAAIYDESTISGEAEISGIIHTNIIDHIGNEVMPCV
jgi:hypothetical protein